MEPATIVQEGRATCRFLKITQHMTTKMGHYVISLARKLDQLKSVITFVK